jgi:hypothetical protein
MLDADTQLDLTRAEPIADMGARMVAAGIESVLGVETWKSNSLSWLRQMMANLRRSFASHCASGRF